MTKSARERFAELAALPDGEIDLALGALLIAAEAREGLDVAQHLRALDRLADEVRPSLAGADSDTARVVRLNQFLFEEKRFIGNRFEYNDPRNSFLDQVIERRTGLPITLSVLYMEVARRLGLQVEGISFPGHFLTKLVSEGELVIDPFNGEILSEADCEQRLQETLGEDAEFDPSYLAAATRSEILARILRNLKQLYAMEREWVSALGCSERILLLEPDAPAELRDRGLIYEQLECFGPARDDLERFVELAGDDPSAEAVRANLERVRQLALHIH